MHRLQKRKILLYILSIVMAHSFSDLVLLAQNLEVPIEVQYALLLKILTFDRNLNNRVGTEIVLGVVYQKKFKMSEQTKDLLVQQMTESAIKTVDGIPIRYTIIDVDREDLSQQVARDPVDLLYITPLRAFDLDEINKISANFQVLTLTGVPDYVESGIAVGIGIKGDRPLIIIHLASAKKAGADFSSQILKLAKVIQK